MSSRAFFKDSFHTIPQAVDALWENALWENRAWFRWGKPWLPCRVSAKQQFQPLKM